MDSFVSGVDELEAFLERNDVESVDVPKLRTLLKPVGNTALSSDEAVKLKHSGLRIWNGCVKLSQTHPNSTLLNVKLRHLSCDVLALAQSFFSSATEEDLLLLCRFFGKTASDWREIHNYELASTCFNTAMEYFERIQRECKSPTDTEITKRNAVLFSIYSMRAEMAMDLQEKEVTYNLVSRAKDLLPYLPEEVHYLAMKCYNLALAYYNNKNIPEAIRWLEESSEIYSKDPNKDPKKQSRTLRLLASAYILVGNLEKASACTVLASEEYDHPAAVYLQLKISFITGRRETITDLVLRLITQKDCTFDIALATCQLTIENKAFETAERALAEIAKRWHTDPREYGKAVSLHVNLLLSPEVNDVNAASLLIDALAPSSLGLESIRAIYASVYRIACSFFENKDYTISLQWFQRSLKFLTAEDESARTQCLRVISRCHIELNQPNEALEYALQGVHGCQDLAQSQFLLFKIYLTLNDAKMASDYLMKLTACSDFSAGFLEVCAHEAYEHKQREVAAAALELLLKRRDGDHSRMGLILRTLVKLCVRTVPSEELNPPQTDLPRLCEALRLGAEKLRQIGIDVMFGGAQSDELKWLVAIAYNHGIETSKNHQNDLAFQLFREAAEFSSYQGDDGLLTHSTSMLLCTASLLQSAAPGPEGKPTLQLVPTYIEKCRATIRRWQDFSREGAEHATALLILMEFEAKARLNEPGLSQIVQQAVNVGLPASKFMDMANMCSNGPSKNIQVCVEALKVCLRLNMQPPVNYSKCAIIFRRLISLTDRDAAHSYFEEVCRILPGLEQGLWPPSELQWLFCEAWNNGVYYYKLLNYAMAEKWMSMSLFLLKYSPDKPAYEAGMYTSYTEVLKHVKPQLDFFPIMTV